MIADIAIVGGGFTGTLCALNLLRHDGPRATLIERRPVAGVGVAYAARSELVLNVRAGSMSAFPDEPGHFLAWLQARDPTATAASFVPRATYGAYLRELLAQACLAAPDRLRTVSGEVRAVADEGGTVRLSLADGATLDADAAVLAIGNLAPQVPPGLAGVAAAASYRADPWSPDAIADLAPDAAVLLVGSGLTMVDVALSLDAQGFTGPIVALSRRGLIPRTHAAGPPVVGLTERPDAPLSTLTRRVRDRGAAIGWRGAVDELRPVTQALWGRASGAERARFLRHLRPWWDVHRHRLAPDVAERFAAMIDRGQLHVAAGRIVQAEDRGDRIDLTWRPRGSDACQTLATQRTINCTGPLADIERTTDPLLAALAAGGTIRPDPEHLGIEVDATGRTIAADGTPNDRLLAAGPMTRGAFWEIVAVPDIRRQVWDLARRLSNAHWVGGEGL